MSGYQEASTVYAFTQIDLLGYDGTLAYRVLVADINAKVIVWGSRAFVQQDDGSYREGFMAKAQSVVTPVNTYLGGIKVQDGF